MNDAGIEKVCDYCKIREEDFIKIWGVFYGNKRGHRLEPDHKDNDYKNNSSNNLCWACCLCNNSKSDKLTPEEMKRVGNIIEEIWRQRKTIGT